MAVHAATYTFAGFKTQGHEYEKSELIEAPWPEYQKITAAIGPLAAAHRARGEGMYLR